MAKHQIIVRKQLLAALRTACPRAQEQTMKIFDAVATRDAQELIAVVDPAFKKAAREAVDRAQASGIAAAGKLPPATPNH
jgi:LDH2 family malate/lactate/ureidoglycolate dehydrogenase